MYNNQTMKKSKKGKFKALKFSDGTLVVKSKKLAKALSNHPMCKK